MSGAAASPALTNQETSCTFKRNHDEMSVWNRLRTANEVSGL